MVGAWCALVTVAFFVFGIVFMAMRGVQVLIWLASMGVALLRRCARDELVAAPTV